MIHYLPRSVEYFSLIDFTLNKGPQRQIVVYQCSYLSWKGLLILLRNSEFMVLWSIESEKVKTQQDVVEETEMVQFLLCLTMCLIKTRLLQKCVKHFSGNMWRGNITWRTLLPSGTIFVQWPPIQFVSRRTIEKIVMDSNKLQPHIRSLNHTKP